MSDPLNILENTEIMHQRIETLTIPTRYCSDGVNNGSCTIVLPNRGSLSGDSRLILPATCSHECYQYSPVAGVFSLIDQCTFRIGDTVICQMDKGNKFYVMQKLKAHLEKRELVDSVLHGINSSFESASGSSRSSDPAKAQVYQGQTRLVCDKYSLLEPSNKVQGRLGARPCLVNGEPFKNYLLKTFSNDTATEAGTPEFSVNLSDIFPGFFGKHTVFPLFLVNKEDEIAIEITFSNNGDFANNERAILCPEKQTSEVSGAIAVTLAENISGTAFTDGTGLVKTVVSSTGNGSGLRIKYDCVAGVPSNIRVLDAGSGYTSTDELTVASDGAGTALNLRIAKKLASSTLANVGFINGEGTGYLDGAAILENLLNPDCNVPVTITAVGGNVKTVTLPAASELNKFLVYPLAEYKILGGNSNANIKLFGNKYTTTNATPAAGAFVVGDQIEVTGTPALRAYVEAIDGNDRPTQIAVIDGDWSAINEAVRSVADNAITCTVTVGAAVDLSLNVCGLGSGGVYSYDVVTPKTEGKINIVTDKVRLATDLIFNDVQDVIDRKASMSKQVINGQEIRGISKVYTQFRNVETTLQGTTHTAYGATNKDENTKLLGYSNEILRNLYFSSYPSGTQSNASFENYNKEKKNPLLLNYCSRDSLVQDGVGLQLTINSVPRYSAPIDTNPYLYTELAECGGPLYVPRSAYCGYLDCKQLDNAILADTLQPGFTTEDSIAVATAQYEQNEHRAGFSNQSYMGVNQKWMRGNLSHMGINLEKVRGVNVIGNGVQIGAQALQIDYNYNSSFNPYYSGQSVLCVYGEVERFFQLYMGKVSVTNAST